MTRCRSRADHDATEEQKQILSFVTPSVELSRPFVVPPGVPADRLAALRAAFAAALRDPLLIEEARKQSIITYRPPDDLLALIHAMYGLPKAWLDRAAELIPARAIDVASIRVI